MEFHGDGGYYYKNFDDSRYYESGNGRYAHYDRPNGDRYVIMNKSRRDSRTMSIMPVRVTSLAKTTMEGIPMVGSTNRNTTTMTRVMVMMVDTPPENIPAVDTMITLIKDSMSWSSSYDAHACCLLY